MSRSNVLRKVFTNTGIDVSSASALDAMRLSVMVDMQFEEAFCEDGLSVADAVAAVAEHSQYAEIINLNEARMRLR